MTTTPAVEPHGEANADHERRFSEDAAEMAASIGSSLRTRSSSPVARGWRSRLGFGVVARRTLGICLLLVTVFMWTLSNFLASLIFSDHTYDKPFFLVYVNTSVFAIALIPRFTKYLLRSGLRGLRNDAEQMWHEHKTGLPPPKPVPQDEDGAAGDRLLIDDEDAALDDNATTTTKPDEEKLNFRETSMLSLEFCMLWFFANYFASACLEYTSVGSATILTSTSSVWTLVFCALFRVEPFTLRKLAGVMASMVGIVLISTVDLTGKSHDDQGTFPDKTTAQIAIGDSMAFISAVVYGMYVTVMKRRVGNEEKVDMKLFFGMVGIFNLLFLWPIFFILHWTDIEPFEMPPSGRIWAIIIVNSLSSFVGDMAWAFAMLLTTPLVVTAGMSLTIPLSLIGEMIQYGQYSSFVYWIGAVVVLVSFAFINHESREEGPGKVEAEREDANV